MSQPERRYDGVTLSDAVVAAAEKADTAASDPFTSQDNLFFQEGDQFTAEAIDCYGTDDATVVVSRKKRPRFSKRMLVALGGLTAVAACTTLAVSHRDSHGSVTTMATATTTASPPRAPIVEALPPNPIPIPTATSPALPYPLPSPPLNTAGAVAVPIHDDLVAACKAAHEQRRTKEVLSTCAQALAAEAAPADAADVAVILAKTEFDRGRARPAFEWAKKAIAADAERADAYVYIGGAEQAAGHLAAAKAAYKRYLQLAPRGRHAAELKAVLASL
jgi:hypothetical protein